MKQTRWFEITGYEMSREKTVIEGYARPSSWTEGTVDVPAIIIFYQTKQGNALLYKFLKRQKIVEQNNCKTWGEALTTIVGTIVIVPDTMIRYMV